MVTADTSVFSIQSGNIVQIQTSNANKAQLYTLRVIAATPSLVTAYVQFTVSFANFCLTTPITPSAIIDSTYIIGQTSLVLTYTAWTEVTGLCGTFTYTAMQSTFDSSNQYVTASQISLDPSLIVMTPNTFTVTTALPSKAGDYAIKLTGSLVSGQSSSQIFKLTVVDPCLTAVLSISGTPVSSSTSVSVFASSFTLQMPTYTSTVSDSLCGTLAYTVQSKLSTSAVYGNPVTPFSYSSMLLTVLSVSVAEIGIYDFQVSIQQGTYTAVIVNYAFTVSIIADCSLEQITSTAISNYNDFNVLTSSSTVATVIVPSFSWTQRFPGLCSAIVYSFIDTATGLLPDSIFQLVSTTSPVSITLLTNDQSKAMTYNLKVLATIDSLPSVFQTFQVTFASVCMITTITPSAIIDQTINVGAAGVTITFPLWTSSVSTCGLFTYTAMQSTLDSSGIYLTASQTALISSLISLTSNTFTVSASLLSQVGVYAIQLTGTLSSSLSSNIVFMITVIDPCPTAVLSTVGTAVISSTSVSVFASATTLQLPTYTSAVSDSLCGTLTQTVQFKLSTASAFGNLITPFSYDSSNKILTIQSISNLDIATYNLQVTIFQASYASHTQSYSFQIVIIADLCLSTTITSSTVSNQAVKVGDSALAITFAAFTESVGTCGSFTYTAMQSTFDSSNQYVSASQISLDASLISFTGNTFTVAATLLSQVGVYALKLTGTLTSSLSSYLIFKLTVVDPCPSAVISTSSAPVADTTVKAFDTSAFTLTLPSYTSSVSSSLCGAISYSLSVKSSPQTSYTATLPATLLAWNAAIDQLTIQSTSQIDVDNSPYSLQMQVYQASYLSAAITYYFNAIVSADCTKEQITTSSLSDYLNYNIYSSGLTTIVPSFTWTQLLPTYCPITYTLIDSLTSLSASAIFQMSSIDHSITLQTSLPANVKTYNLIVKASIGLIVQTRTFQVTFADICGGSTITPSILANQTYQIGSASLMFSFNQWSESTSGLCGPITYTVYQSVFDSSNQYLTSAQTILNSNLITFDYINLQFTVLKQTSSTNIGVYAVKIIGTLTNGTIVNSFFQVLMLTITYPSVCLVTNLQPSSVDAPSGDTMTIVQYNIGQGTLIIPISDFLQTTNCQYPVIYQISIIGLSTIPAFITPMINSSPLSISIQSNSRADAIKPFLTLVLTGTVTQNGFAPITSSLSIPISVSLVSSGPPAFNSALLDVKMIINTTQTITLPAINDPNILLAASFSGITFNPTSAANFVTGQFPTYTLAPIIDPTDIGTFAVSVTLKDNNPTLVVSATYIFNIIVSGIVQITTNSTGSTNNSSSSSNNTSIATQNNNGVSNFTFSNRATNLSVTNKTKGIILSLQIKNIDANGLVTIQFSTEVLNFPVEAYSMVNESLLHFQVMPGKDQNKNLINITSWNLTYISPLQMKIQLQFQNPLIISSRNVSFQQINLLVNGLTRNDYFEL